jgi:hypothetical protein
VTWSMRGYPKRAEEELHARVSELISLVVCLLLVIALATIYSVAKTGSDAYSCAQAQSQGTPEQTIQAAVSCATTPGDRSL